MFEIIEKIKENVEKAKDILQITHSLKTSSHAYERFNATALLELVVLTEDRNKIIEFNYLSAT